MKRQKLREEKKLQEVMPCGSVPALICPKKLCKFLNDPRLFLQDILLGRFQRKRRATEQRDRRRPEGGVLMASDGVFKKGVLNVKHLLGGPSQPSNEGTRSLKATGGRRKKGKGNNKGKKKGKRH